MSHACLYIARSLETAGIPDALLVQSADVEHVCTDAFGIDAARALQARASIRPVAGTTRSFVIRFTSITSEAQNALLKLFEDPPEGVQFHMVIDKEELLLPTLRSRLVLLNIAEASIDHSDFDTFLAHTMGERIAEIGKRAKAKDVDWFENIATGIEFYAVQQSPEKREALLRSVVFVRTYLGARGASSKMLLEELALSL